MKILAFETSAKAASVALLEEGKLLGSVYQNTGLTHSQTLMVMAQDLLDQLSLTPADVDILAGAPAPLQGSASAWLPPRALPGAGRSHAAPSAPWPLWRRGWGSGRAMCAR